MKQQNDFKIDYLFGNPDHHNLDDSQSYHSIDNDDKKQFYFQQENQRSSVKIMNLQKRKNPLPPAYPYVQINKLKQSLKLLRKSSDLLIDNKSVRSIDSFVTVNQFQSICYEDGDFQKMINDIEGNHSSKKQQLNEPQKTNKSNSSFRSIQYNSISHINPSQININQINILTQNKNFQLKQSSLLNNADILDLQQNEDRQEHFEGFDQNDIPQDRQNYISDNANHEQEKSVEISHIKQILNQSDHLDAEILELTLQLQKVQSSQQQLLQKDLLSQEGRRRQQQLRQRYQSIQNRMKQLQESQKGFSSQINYFNQIIKKARHNNDYLKKQVQFFKLKTIEMQQKQQQLNEKNQKYEEQAKLRQKQLRTSKNNSFSLLSQSRMKLKTYNIKPKAPNNQSKQSKKYKQLTFEYCFGHQQQSQQKWIQFQTDSQEPPQYQIAYSFQQNNSLFVIRLLDLAVNQASAGSVKKQPNCNPNTTKRNYQYLMDFGDNSYPDNNKKKQALSKQLIIHLEQGEYRRKQFTKKIQVFLVINEGETYIDLVRVIPLPNPLVFYIERRFGSVVYSSASRNINSASCNINSASCNISSASRNISSASRNISSASRNISSDQGQVQIKQAVKSKQQSAFRNLSNLCRFMKTYVIRIQQMADIDSIQKLMGLQWVNNSTTQQLRYFSVNVAPENKSETWGNQLFYVKIEDCVLETTWEHRKLDEKLRYSLLFTVASTTDNQVLVDLIEFLTFLTVM